MASSSDHAGAYSPCYDPSWLSVGPLRCMMPAEPRCVLDGAYACLNNPRRQRIGMRTPPWWLQLLRRITTPPAIAKTNQCCSAMKVSQTISVQIAMIANMQTKCRAEQPPFPATSKQKMEIPPVSAQTVLLVQSFLFKPH